MNEILIISLSRYGDHIQSTPLLRNLRARHPGARITMVAERRFDDILPLIKGIDRTILFDNRELAWRVAMEDDPLASYAFLDAFVRQLEDTRYDLVVNITLSRLSDFLVSLAPATDISGTIAGKNGRRRFASHWARYFLAAINDNNRRMNRINLVDVFTGIGGGRPDGLPVELIETDRGASFADEFLAKEGLRGKRVVGLQLGASKPIRCWEMESFAALCDRLQEQWGCSVVLFGGPGERNLAKQVSALAAHPPVDAVGKTSIEELFSLVKRCAFLVTNDTGTMHFAAAGGVPSIMLCLGPAFFHGTGPYSSGNIALQPDLACSPCPYSYECPAPLCKKAITVDAVEGACRILLRDTPVSPGPFAGVRVFRSRFGPDRYLEWEGLFNADGAEDQAAQRYGEMWKRFLDGSPPAPGREASGPPRELKRMLERGLELTDRILEIAVQPDARVEELRRLGAGESVLADEIRHLGSRHPELATLVDFLTLTRDDITEDELARVADATRRIYHTGGAILSNL